MTWNDYLGEFVAGTGAALSNVVGYPVRLGPGGSSLGANIAGESQPYFEGMYSPTVLSPLGGAGGSAYTDPSAIAGFNQTLVEQGKTQPTTNTGGGIPSGQPSAPADSPLRQLEKIGWDNMNPSQRSEYLRLIGAQQQAYQNSPEYKAEQARAQQQRETELNNIYSPLFGSLDVQQRNIEAQQPGAEQQLQGQYAAGIEGVTGQQSEAQMQLARRGTASDTAQANALAQARQLYSELQQRYGSMFGSRSSTGPAAQELLGRETARRFGEVGTAREQDRQAIADETTRLNTWVNTQKNEWGRKRDEAISSLQNVFRQKIGEINAQRGQLESQKAAQRYQVLIDTRNQQMAVEQADKDFRQRLALFQAQQQPYAMNNIGQTTQGLGQFSPSQMGQTGTQQTIDTSFAGGKRYWDAVRGIWVTV